MLRLTGWAQPVRLLRQVEHNGELFWTANQQYGRYVFRRRAAPLPSHVWSTVRREPGTKRVVVIGESAAAGFPIPDFNLARMIEGVWQYTEYGQPIEVINVTMTGVNSHILRLFMREVEVLDPDKIIVYAGHNEAIGPFGPASVFGQSRVSLWGIRSVIALRHSRTGQLLERIGVMRGSLQEQLPAWGGLNEFAESALFPGDPALEAMYRHTRANVNAMLRRADRKGVPVLLVQPAVNLTDWPPLRSRSPVVPDEQVVSAWRAGDLDALPSAWQVFRVARKRADMGDWDVAWPLFRFALELDGARFRADHRIRTLFQELASKYTEVHVLDADRALHEDHLVFLSDREYFYEHVHLTFAGAAWIADVIAQEVARGWGISESDTKHLSIDQLAEQLLYTDLETAQSWRQVRDFYVYDVFARQPEADERKAYMDRLIDELEERISDEWDSDRLAALYEQALAVRPHDEALHFIAGRHFFQLRDLERARQAIEKGLSQNPSYTGAYHALARIYIAEGAYAEAEAMLDLLDSQIPDFPRTARLRGQIYAQFGRVEEALPHFEQAIKEEPFDYKTLVNLGTAYQLLGKDQEAIATFRRCLDMYPSDASVLNNSAWLIATSENMTAMQRTWAVDYAERAVGINPEHHRYWGTLAVAHAANGNTDQAREIATVALLRSRAADDQDALSALRAELLRWDISVPRP